jgi:hypothetical protein
MARESKNAHRMKFACLDVRLARLGFKDKSATRHQSLVDALEKAPQPGVTPIQMNPLRYRKPENGTPSGRSIVASKDGEQLEGSSRNNYVVVRIIFRDAFIHPVGTAERDVVRKRVL